MNGNSEVIDLLDQLVSYDTRTWKNTPAAEVKELIEEILVPLFEEHGFNWEIIESEGHYSIFAEKSGDEPKILYSGHLDVVPWDDRWSTDPQNLTFDEENGEKIVRGRGVSDMKSGVAALMTALPKIAESDGHIMFALTGDEEIGGENGTGVIVDMLAEQDKLPTYVLTADAAGMEIISRRRNVFNVTISHKTDPIKITGKREQRSFKTAISSSDTSHAAYFDRSEDDHCVKLASQHLQEENAMAINIDGNWVSTNVIPEEVHLDYVIPTEDGQEIMADQALTKLLELAEKFMDIKFETEVESTYGINSTINQIEKTDDNHWEMIVDIRAMLSQDSRILDEKIKDLVAEVEYPFEIDIFRSVGYIATPENSPLVTATTDILDDLGYPTDPAERGGATDGRFFAKYNIQTIDIGAIGWNVHGPNETATVQSIKDEVKFFEKSAQRIYEDYHQSSYKL